VLGWDCCCWVDIVGGGVGCTGWPEGVRWDASVGIETETDAVAILNVSLFLLVNAGHCTLLGSKPVQD